MVSRAYYINSDATTKRTGRPKYVPYTPYKQLNLTTSARGVAPTAITLSLTLLVRSAQY